MQKEVRQHMGRKCVERGEKIDQETAVRLCPSVFLVSGWRGGYFQVELTRKDGVLDYGQQAPQPSCSRSAEFRAQNSEPKNWGGQGVEGCTSPQTVGTWASQAGRRDGQ